MATHEESLPEILVSNPRPWFGDPRLGAFSVFVDRHFAGRVLPEGQVSIPISTGSHVVRVRSWWYASTPLRIDVAQDDVQHLSALRPSGLSGFWSLLVRPRRSLRIEGGNEFVPPDARSRRAASQRDRLIALSVALLAALGCLLIAAGATGNVALVVAGIFMITSASGGGFWLARRSRRQWVGHV